MKIVKRKRFKCAELNTWPDMFNKNAAIGQSFYSPFDNHGIRLEIRSDERREQMATSVVSTAGVYQYEKVHSKIAIGGEAWEIYLDEGDIVISAYWDWSQQTINERIRIRVLQYRGYDLERAEAKFVLTEKFDLESMHDIMFGTTFQFIDSLPSNIRSDAKILIRMLLRSPGLKWSRELRHRKFLKTF